MFNDNVTIINRYRSQGKECFKKHIIYDCMWKESVTKFINNGVITNAKEITLTVLFNGTYVPPKTYSILEEINKDTHFTFQEGDYIVLGEVAESVSTPLQIKDMMANYEHIGIITSVIDSTNVDEKCMKKMEGNR